MAARFYVLLWYLFNRYTLGGFYLARYADSPVGAFDEVWWTAVQGTSLLMVYMYKLCIMVHCFSQWLAGHALRIMC